MSASQFVDESALPEWLQMQGGQPVAGSNGNGNGAGQPWGAQQRPPQAPPSVPPRAPAPPNRFSASDLVDPNAMPQWAQGGEAAPTFDAASGWGSPARPSSPGEVAPPDAYGRSSLRRGANGNGNGRSQGMPAAGNVRTGSAGDAAGWGIGCGKAGSTILGASSRS